jgi:hypothetical protein
MIEKQTAEERPVVTAKTRLPPQQSALHVAECTSSIRAGDREERERHSKSQKSVEIWTRADGGEFMSKR